MIVLYHNNGVISQVYNQLENIEVILSNKKLTLGLLEICEQFPKTSVIWCSVLLKDSINFKEFQISQSQPWVVQSFNTSCDNYFPEEIGYVNESFQIKVNKKVKFATWQMSSDIGVINSEVINCLKKDLNFDLNFDYFINSLAKLAMPLGLFCYSNPALISDKKVVDSENANLQLLFRFVSQHQKKLWIFLLFFNLLIYEKRFAFFELIFSLFAKKRTLKSSNLLESLKPESTYNSDFGTLDVLIPTIGRQDFLYDFLTDLNEQEIVPTKVIIVEQNPEKNSVSALNFLIDEKWNFKIKHIFTHQAGACNARNLGLLEITSDWVFFADDDIRVQPNFIKNAFSEIYKYNANAVTFRCYLENEKKVYKDVFQWATFGSGCSFVKTAVLKNLKFDESLEFGFGEDADFGMQLRNQGNDILYLPEPSILHLKAPIGGFRTKPVLAWHQDTVQPKPSPTVMFYKIKHDAKNQILGYKTNLFINFYKHQKIKNLFIYYKNFKKQWNQSVFWANELKRKNK